MPNLGPDLEIEDYLVPRFTVILLELNTINDKEFDLLYDHFQAEGESVDAECVRLIQQFQKKIREVRDKAWPDQEGVQDG